MITGVGGLETTNVDEIKDIPLMTTGSRVVESGHLKHFCGSKSRMNLVQHNFIRSEFDSQGDQNLTTEHNQTWQEPIFRAKMAS